MKVVGDSLLALDSGNLALLSLLDLSAAFNTVDHDTLLRRLQTSYDLDGVVIKWFVSYLSGRTQHVRTLTTKLLPSPVAYEVPQGSVLGPILFRLDALALSVIATATCLAGWLGGWLSHSSQVKIQFNPQKIATKGFSTDSGRF